MIDAQLLKEIYKGIAILIWTCVCILLYQFLMNRSMKKMMKDMSQPGLPMFKSYKHWPPTGTPLWIKLHDKALPEPFYFYSTTEKRGWLTIRKGWFGRNGWIYYVKDVTRWSFQPFAEEKENEI